MLNTLKQTLNTKISITTFAVFAITVTFTSLYYNFHPLHLISYAFIIPILLVAKVLGGNRTYNIIGSVKQLALLLFIASILILSIYGYYFYNYFYKGYNFYLPEYSRLVTSFLQNFVLYAVTLLIYLSATISIGSRILQVLRYKGSYLSTAFLSLILGITVYSLLFFLLAAYSIFTIPYIVAATLIGLVSNYKYVFQLFKKAAEFFKLKFSVKLMIDEILLFSLIGIFLATFLVSVLRSFSLGPDAVRLYLVLIEYFAKYHELPSTQLQAQFPFSGELFFTPAYLIGGIPVTTAILYTLSILYIIPFFLICRDYAKSYKDYWVLLPIFIFQQSIHIYVSQFKVDTFVLLITSSIIYLSYRILKSYSKPEVLIAGLLIGFTATAKLTSIWLTAPVGVLIAFLIIKSESSYKSKIVTFVSFAILGLLPIILWLTFYRISVPYFTQPIGLGLSPRAAPTIMPYQLSECTATIPDMEQQGFYGGLGKNWLGYLQIPASLIRTNGKTNMFSMLDIGAQLIITVPIFLYLFLSRKISFPDKKILVLAWIALVSSIPWLILTPILTWYAGSTLLLILLVVNLAFLKSDYAFAKQLVKTVNIFVSASYIIGLFTTHALNVYFPPDLKGDELLGYLRVRGFHYQTYIEAKEISDYVNEDPDSIIMFSSVASFANINYYTDRYFDRVVYLDMFTDSITLSESGFKPIMEKIKPDYFVKNKISAASDWDCLFAQQYYFEELFEKNGEVVLENNAFQLYKVKN